MEWRSIGHTWAALVSLSAVACAGGAGSVERDIGTQSAELPWGDWVGDADCSSLLPNGGRGVDMARRCSAAEMRGRATDVDELYRRFAWNVFVRYLTPPQPTDRAPDGPGEDAGSGTLVAGQGCDEVCKDPTADAIEEYRAPAWDYRGSERDTHPPAQNPVWDQNGNCVQIEVRMDERSAEHERLMTAEGQIALMCQGFTRTANWGEPSKPAPVRIKLAWRTIVEGDCEKYDFITRSGDACRAGDLGLVAAHVVAKADSTGDYWLWATFSHENNVDAPNGAKPLFRDPGCKSCPDNRCPQGQSKRTQIKRLTAIPEAVRRTKAEGIARKRIVGVFQRYELLGVQRLPAVYDEGDLPAAAPEILANEILEWDRQDSSCMGCHSRARVAAFADQAGGCKSLCGGTGLCRWDRAMPGTRVCAADRRCQEVQRRALCINGDCYTGGRPVYLADFSWQYDLWAESRSE